jgi:hypothetical protein
MAVSQDVVTISEMEPLKGLECLKGKCHLHSRKSTESSRIRVHIRYPRLFHVLFLELLRLPGTQDNVTYYKLFITA